MSLLRPLVAADLDSMSTLVTQWTLEGAEQAFIHWDSKKLALALQNSNSLGLLDSTHTLLGFVIYQSLGEEADIHLIVSGRGQARKGIGQTLIAVLKDQYLRLTLEVHEQNFIANNFYRKQGFKLDGQRPN